MVARAVLVTGSNRGLGLEMVRQLARHVTPPDVIIATCRNPEAAQELQQLSKSHKEVNLLKLDVADEGSYAAMVRSVSEMVGDQGLNLLINNAGVAPKSTRITQVKWQQMVDTFLVNSVAPVMLSKAFLPMLKIAATQAEGSGLSVKRAAIINISSVLGSIEKNDKGGIYPYRASKAALNAITKSLSNDVRDSNILVSSVCPGWTQTDMGGKNAALTPEQSIFNVLHLLSTMNETHHGQFYQYDGVKLPW
ncbi:C-factor-like [Portunus trituberculatus]|uniref:C-factor-like n=1 Tax=Portunus trituberculatus TaxID=210409 RepID=UPI001E1CBAB8|nr:C-factor-like [Portunus trituberculatus]